MEIKKSKRYRNKYWLSMVAPFTQGWKALTIPTKSEQKPISPTQKISNFNNKKNKKTKKQALEIAI